MEKEKTLSDKIKLFRKYGDSDGRDLRFFFDFKDLDDSENDIKQHIQNAERRLIMDLISSRQKYGLDWCDQLFIKNIKQIFKEEFGDELIENVKTKS